MREEKRNLAEKYAAEVAWQDWEEMKACLQIMLQEPERIEGGDCKGLQVPLPGTSLVQRCVLVPRTDYGAVGVVRIEEKMLKAWGKTPQQVFQAAAENLSKNSRPLCIRLTEMIRQMSPVPVDDIMPDLPILVLTNEKQFLGASVIAVQGLLRDILKESPLSLFYVVPSSLHEVLLVPGDMYAQPEELAALLREVNRVEVPPDQILSDRLLAYSIPEDRLYEVQL